MTPVYYKELKQNGKGEVWQINKKEMVGDGKNKQ